MCLFKPLRKNFLIYMHTGGAQTGAVEEGDR